MRNYLVKKADLKMPEAFLKRWLYTINEGKFTMEEIEKDFDQFLKMFTWNYLQKHFIKADNLSVSKEEAEAEAKALAAAQFAQYGMPSAPEDMLAGYAGKILADKEQGQKIYEKLYETKVVEDVKSKVKVTEKSGNRLLEPCFRGGGYPATGRFPPSFRAGKTAIKRRNDDCIRKKARNSAKKYLSLDFAGLKFAKSFF